MQMTRTATAITLKTTPAATTLTKTETKTHETQNPTQQKNNQNMNINVFSNEWTQQIKVIQTNLSVMSQKHASRKQQRNIFDQQQAIKDATYLIP